MLLTLAFRNIWRNRRRTLLTLSAMIASLALLILALGVFSGMFADMLASATEQYQGHLVISEAGYQEDRDLYANFAEDPALEEKLAARPEVTGVSPRLRAFGLFSHGDKTYPVELLGIRPAAEAEVTSLARQLTAGSFVPTSGGRFAVLGEGLARRLEVVPGDQVVFVSQAADGSFANDLLTVSGIFATGDSGHDNRLVLVPLPWLQRIMVLPGRLHELALGLEDPMAAPAEARRLQPLLPPRLEAVDWGTLLPEMRDVIASFDVSRMILVTILYLATGLGVLNTFFMSVMERTREFGILMAMGMKPWRIRAMVLLETLAMGLISLAVGVAGGLAMTAYMKARGIDLSGFITAVTYAGGTILPRLRATFEVENFVLPAVVLLAVCLLAGYLPARRAARLKPIEAIREE